MENKKWKFHKKSDHQYNKRSDHPYNKKSDPSYKKSFNSKGPLKKRIFHFQIKKVKGNTIFDLNQNTYLDFDLNEGSLILGHNDIKLTRNLKNQISKGYVFPNENHLKYQLKKIILSYYPLMNDIDFYHEKISVLIKIFSILEELAISKKRKKIGKILFIGREFYSLYSSLIESSLFLKNIINENSYFLPEFDINMIEKILKNQNQSSKIGQLKNWFFKKIPNKNLKNETNPIDIIVFSPMYSNEKFGALKNKDYEDLQNLAKKYEILRILDQNYYTLRLGLKGHHPSYFMHADMYIFNQAIGSGFNLYGLAASKEKEYLIKYKNNDSLHYDISNFDTSKRTYNQFFPLPYLAGISNLKIIQFKNPYPSLKNLNQALAYKMEKIGKTIEIYESMFYIRNKKDKGLDNKLYNWGNFNEASQNLHYMFYNSYFNHLNKNFIFFNPKHPFLGFLSMSHDESNIKQLVKYFENSH